MYTAKSVSLYVAFVLGFKIYHEIIADLVLSVVYCLLFTPRLFWCDCDFKYKYSDVSRIKSADIIHILNFVNNKSVCLYNLFSNLHFPAVSSCCQLVKCVYSINLIDMCLISTALVYKWSGNTLQPVECKRVSVLLKLYHLFCFFLVQNVCVYWQKLLQNKLEDREYGLSIKCMSCKLLQRNI